MEERLKELRNALQLNQRDFSDRTKIGRSTYAMFETGQRSPKDIHISQICRAYNVNETWLRTGEGEMFIERDDSLLSQLALQYKLDGVSKAILASFLNLDEKNRAVILDFIKSTMAQVFETSFESIEPYMRMTVEDQERERIRDEHRELALGLLEEAAEWEDRQRQIKKAGG